MAEFTAQPGKRILLGGGKRVVFGQSGEFETDDKEIIAKLDKAKGVTKKAAPKPKPKVEVDKGE
jgi:hypothetical protein